MGDAAQSGEDREMNLSAQQSFSLLRDSLAEAQTTVRAYDTKAQIIGVGISSHWEL